MIHQDITGTIASYPDDSSLIQVSLDQNFWHQRVETLSGRRIEFSREVDWEQTYSILSQELQKKKPSFWNEEDNSTVSLVLLSLNFKPEPESIMRAAQHGSNNIMKFFLEEGSIDPGVIISGNRSPFLLAAEYGQEEIVKLLLADSRIDLNSNMKRCVSALSMACFSCHEAREGAYNRIVELLLRDGRADPRRAESSALWNASYSRDNDIIIKLLLEDGRADPSDAKSRALVEAAGKGRPKSMTLLLRDPRVNPADFLQVLAEASGCGHQEVVKILLADPRVDPSEEDNLALIRAVENRRGEVVKLLVRDPRINRDSWKLAFTSSMKASDHPDMIVLLIEELGIDPSCEDNYLLKQAIDELRPIIVKQLLEYEEVRSSVNDKVRSLARWKRNSKIIELISSI